MKLSKTEQDYIKTIYEIQHKNDQTIVGLKQLVDKLGVSAPTVTEMVKRLEKKLLIVYQSYKGVYLTETGLHEATFILKAHRVWEYFLLNTLKYQEAEVHNEAEALEHAASPMLIERLYSYLGKPEVCPHGQQIPHEVFWFEQKQIITLKSLPKGRRVAIAVLPETTQEFLTKLGVETMPTMLKIEDSFEDDTLIITIDDGQRIVLPPLFQQGIQVIEYQV